MSWKNPGKVRARTYGTKSPSRSEALRFIDSAKAQCFRLARRFGAVGSSLDFSRFFSRYSASRHLNLSRYSSQIQLCMRLLRLSKLCCDSIRILILSATYQLGSIGSCGLKLMDWFMPFFSLYSEPYFVHNPPSTEPLYFLAWNQFSRHGVSRPFF